MIRAMTLKEVSQVTGGRIVGGDAAFTSVSIDTRTLKSNELFIAISGPNFNGNEFVQNAVEKNAVAAITTEYVDVNIPILQVEDTKEALGKIALMNRNESSSTVIALTGSQGKTTVKEMLAKILSACGDVIFTQGNLNNEYGVPLSLLKIKSEHEYAVIEMGANAPGDIAYCVELTKPNIAHITNVADTHIEGFGSLDGVASAKSEIWDGLVSDGIAVINIDDKYSKLWLDRTKNKKCITISVEGKESADFSLENITLNENFSADFNLKTPQGNSVIHLPLAGKHNCANALAAAALAMVAGATLDQVRLGLCEMKAVNGRFCKRDGINQSVIIDDSYNASPASFKAAIDSLCLLPGKKIIAMGDMGELGSNAESAHFKVGEYAKECGVENFYATGELSQYAVKGFGPGAEFEIDRKKLSQRIVAILESSESASVNVLIKGSRSAGMDKLVDDLIEERGE